MREKRSWSNSQMEVLDWLSWGVAICTPTGRIVHQNSMVRRILQKEQGNSARNDALVTGTQPDQVRLRELLARAAVGAISGGTFIGIDGELNLLALPVGQDGESFASDDAGRIAVVLSHRDARCEPSVDLLGELFGFTRAEASLAAALCGGVSLRDYANGRGISIFTARHQAKQVLSKAGASRQSDLVRTIYDSAAGSVRAAAC